MTLSEFKTTHNESCFRFGQLMVELMFGEVIWGIQASDLTNTDEIFSRFQSSTVWPLIVVNFGSMIAPLIWSNGLSVWACTETLTKWILVNFRHHRWLFKGPPAAELWGLLLLLTSPFATLWSSHFDRGQTTLNSGSSLTAHLVRIRNRTKVGSFSHFPFRWWKMQSFSESRKWAAFINNRFISRSASPASRFPLSANGAQWNEPMGKVGYRNYD